MRIYTVSVICCAVQFRIYFSDHISGLGNAFGRLCVYVCVADDNVSTVTETSLINPVSYTHLTLPTILRV